MFADEKVDFGLTDYLNSYQNYGENPPAPPC
jgi:hypothetical protein